MTVNTQVARAGPYIGNGVTTTFDRTFLVLNDDHLKVFQTVDGVRSEVTTGITKNGVGNATGTVVFDTPPALGVQIVLLREVTLEQQTDLSTQGKVQPVQVEADLDYIMLALQDAKERRDRTPLLPVDTSETDIELPVPQDGRVLVGRADAGGWENGETFADFAAAATAAAASAAQAATSEATAAAAAAATAGDVTSADAARVAAEAAQAAAEAALAEIQNIIGSGDFNFTSFTYDSGTGDIDVDFTLSVATDVVFYLSSSATPPTSEQMDDGTGSLEYFTETLATGLGSFTETVATGLSLPLYLYARVTGGVTIRMASLLPAVGTFTTQPTIGAGNQGDTITLTEGVFSAAATITIEEFTLDAVDKSGDLSGLDWDTTPETAYGVDGAIRWQVKATDTFGREVLSNVITGTLRDVPDRFVAGDWTATANGSGGITVAIINSPDDGNTAIVDLEYRVEGGAWTTSGGTGGFTISGLSDGDKDVEIRATNGVGDAATSDTKTVTISGQQTNIVINSVGPQTAGTGEVPVDYSVVSNDAGVEGLIFLATDADPVAADFDTGATTGYIDLGPVSLTVNGADILLAGPDGLLGNYKIALLPTGGGDADVVVSEAFALDSTDTVISPSAATSGAGAGEVDVTFTPDEAGTYRVSLFADGAAPSDAAIRDGTGAVATATGSGVAATQVAETLTGVASTAYDVHIYYVDGFGNEVFTAAIDATSGGGAGAGYVDDFSSYANGSDLSAQTNYSAGANDSGTDNLVVDTGDVEVDGTDGTNVTATVTHSADPGSDDTFLEIDFTVNRAPSLLLTRIRCFIGNIEMYAAATGNLQIRDNGSGVAAGGFTVSVGTLQTVRFEIDDTNGTAEIFIDGVSECVATGLTFAADRTFEWGIQISDSDQRADITIHDVQAGAI